MFSTKEITAIKAPKKEEVKKTIPKNVFVFTVKFMHGDADGYSTKQFKIKNTGETSEKDVIEFSNLLNCILANQSGFGGGERYDEFLEDWQIDSKSFHKFFKYPNENSQNSDEIHYDFTIPNDKYNFEDTDASFDGFELNYFDNEGTKFNIEIA